MSKKPTKKNTSSKNKGSTKTLLLITVTCLITIIIFKVGFVFFVISLLPSIVAYYLDVGRSRTTFHTVFACNMSGLLPFIAKLTNNPSTGGGYVTELMSDPLNWLQIYAAAGFGWLLVFATPLFAQFIISMFNTGQIARFQSMQDRIIKDWGPEVANIFPTNPKEDD